MNLSPRAKNILSQITGKTTKLGDFRALAKGIKKDHQLAMELWSTQHFFARQLAILIMDNNLLTEKVIDGLVDDIGKHDEKEKIQQMDWLMANQLNKNKKTVALMETWEESPTSLKRRIFWYYTARLRWTGRPQPNSEKLLTKIENRIADEKPEVQWAMNFAAGWIGVFEKQLRSRCIALGQETELYKGQMVSKGCTPDYLPKFIAIESNKRNL